MQMNANDLKIMYVDVNIHIKINDNVLFMQYSVYFKQRTKYNKIMTNDKLVLFIMTAESLASS